MAYADNLGKDRLAAIMGAFSDDTGLSFVCPVRVLTQLQPEGAYHFTGHDIKDRRKQEAWRASFKDSLTTLNALLEPVLLTGTGDVDATEPMCPGKPDLVCAELLANCHTDEVSNPPEPHDTTQSGRRSTHKRRRVHRPNEQAVQLRESERLMTTSRLEHHTDQYSQPSHASWTAVGLQDADFVSSEGQRLLEQIPAQYSQISPSMSRVSPILGDYLIGQFNESLARKGEMGSEQTRCISLLVPFFASIGWKLSICVPGSFGNVVTPHQAVESTGVIGVESVVVVPHTNGVDRVVEMTLSSFGGMQFWNHVFHGI